MKKFLALLMAALMVLGLCACQPKEPEVKAMSYDEYIAAELDSAVVVDCYVQDNQSWWDGKLTVYAADENGAYFIYNMACATAEDAAKLVPGTKIRVTGTKTEWSGEVEIADATYEILEGKYIAPAKDVTALLGTDDLIKNQNAFVAFKGMTVEDAGNGAAFMYNWDGSGTPGSDLYFNVSKDGKTYTFTVESYLRGDGTDVYEAVEALTIGDVIDMEGFLYWYNGVNPHITNVTVVEKAPEATKNVGLALDLKNKTGVTINAVYVYPAGSTEFGGSIVEAGWPDKDADGDKYEVLVYIIREAGKTYDVRVEFEDGTNATWEGLTISDYDKLSFKGGVDPAKWEQEPADEEDKPAMDEVKAAGKTADNYYPGYEKLGLEIKNKTELAIAEMYIYETGASYEKYNNIIAYVVDAEGNHIETLQPGKGGMYLFGFFLRPYSDTYEMYIVYENGETLTVSGIELFTPDADGHCNNEISLKDTYDGDLEKIAYDDGDPEPLQYIADAIAAGIPMDEWYPAY